MFSIRYFFLLILSATIVTATQPPPSFYVPEKISTRYANKYGDLAVRRLNSLLKMMEETKDLPEYQKITKVNTFFNRLQYRQDLQNWGKSDYWASRLEFLGKGMGDCEDYAVAKFLTLIQLGVSSKKLFLTYAKALKYNEAHLVATYYKRPGTVPYVLDNYTHDVLPATQRRDLIPVYSFTADDLYIQKQQGLGKKVNRNDLKNQKKLKAVELEIQVRR